VYLVLEQQPRTFGFPCRRRRDAVRGEPERIAEAGFKFIAGSRISKALYDLAEHFERHGDYFTDGQILESSRVLSARA
jgi:hypothetical protein